MTEILDFIGKHSILTFFLLWLVLAFFGGLIRMPFRMITLYKHGYPPPHCNIDGQIIKKNSEDL